jgi:hypothetical protein
MKNLMETPSAVPRAAAQWRITPQKSNLHRYGPNCDKPRQLTLFHAPISSFKYKRTHISSTGKNFRTFWHLTKEK